MTAHSKARRSFVFLALIPTLSLAFATQDKPDWEAKYQAGVAAVNRGQYAEAVRLLGDASALSQAFPMRDLRRSRTTSVLAMAYQFSGQIDRAEALYLEAKGNLDPSHPEERSVLAFTLDGLSQLHYQRGRVTESEELLKPALDLCNQSSGTKSLCTVTVLRHLGEVYATLGRSAEAETTLQQVINLFRETTSLPRASLASTLRTLGSLYLLQGRYPLAQPLFEESLQITETFGEVDASLADSQLNLGRLYRMQHDAARALPLLKKATNTYEALGDGSLATAFHELGLLAIDEGKFAVARQHLDRAGKLIEKSYGPGNITLAFIQVALAETSLGEHKYDQAESLVQKALAKERSVLPDSHDELARAYLLAARIEASQHRDSAADAHYRQALDIYRRSLDGDSPDLKKAEQMYRQFVSTHK